MNVLELAREYFPLFSDDHLEQILFTCTAYPATSEESFLRKQLVSIQARSGGLFHRAVEIAHDDLDRAMEKRVTPELSTYQIKRLRDEMTANDKERYRLAKELQEAEKDLILNVSEWASECDCEFNFDGLDYKLWPKTLNSHYSHYVDMGDGVTFHMGSYCTDTLEEMRAFIEKCKFRSVIVSPIHSEVLSYAAQLGLN